MDEQEISFGGVAEPMVAAAPRIGDVPRPRRGVRSGPIAAVMATVAIVAATAVPSPSNFTGPPLAPAAVTASFDIDGIPALEGLGALKLGNSFGGYTLQASQSSWDDRRDGSSTLRLRLTSDVDPSTFLFADFTLQGRTSSTELDVLSRRLFQGVTSSFIGGEGWLTASEPAMNVDVYTSLSGTLLGAGDLEGTAIEVRNIPGTSVRRGPWTGVLPQASKRGRSRSKTVAYDDTVFARVIWMFEDGGSSEEIQSEGAGTLSLYLSPESSGSSSSGDE